VPSIATYIDEALVIQKNSQRAQIVELVVYNLPDRDCSAKASDGELKIADDGLNKYKLFIDGILEYSGLSSNK
jgi:cellulose 1,4-beta-cellobiosidase